MALLLPICSVERIRPGEGENFLGPEQHANELRAYLFTNPRQLRRSQIRVSASGPEQKVTAPFMKLGSALRAVRQSADTRATLTLSAIEPTLRKSRELRSTDRFRNRSLALGIWLRGAKRWFVGSTTQKLELRRGPMASVDHRRFYRCPGQPFRVGPMGLGWSIFKGWLVDRGVIAQDYNDERGWNAIDALTARRWPTRNGREIEALQWGIDTGSSTQALYDRVGRRHALHATKGDNKPRATPFRRTRQDLRDEKGRAIAGRRLNVGFIGTFDLKISVYDGLRSLVAGPDPPAIGFRITTMLLAPQIFRLCFPVLSRARQSPPSPVRIIPRLAAGHERALLLHKERLVAPA